MDLVLTFSLRTQGPEDSCSFLVGWDLKNCSAINAGQEQQLLFIYRYLKCIQLCGLCDIYSRYVHCKQVA